MWISVREQAGTSTMTLLWSREKRLVSLNSSSTLDDCEGSERAGVGYLLPVKLPPTAMKAALGKKIGPWPHVFIQAPSM